MQRLCLLNINTLSRKPKNTSPEFKFIRVHIMRKVPTILPAILLLGLLSGCTALDVEPWTTEEVLGDVISSTIIGNKVSSGNRSKCNQIKMQCPASDYSERYVNGEIRCSCRS